MLYGSHTVVQIRLVHPGMHMAQASHFLELDSGLGTLLMAFVFLGLGSIGSLVVLRKAFIRSFGQGYHTG